MQDISVFTTTAGVASLILKEIPYKKEAYIKIQDSLEPEKLLKECYDFCRAVGAERIYVSEYDGLRHYPLHATLQQMRRSLDGLPQTDAVAVPVEERSLEQWRQIYNTYMRNVPKSATMTIEEAKKHSYKQDGYFIYREEMLIGIGIASGQGIDAVVSLHPGAGQDVLVALAAVLVGEQVLLEVALENHRAIHLYQRLGFETTGEIARWYRVEY